MGMFDKRNQTNHPANKIIMFQIDPESMEFYTVAKFAVTATACTSS